MTWKPKVTKRGRRQLVGRHLRQRWLGNDYRGPVNPTRWWKRFIPAWLR